jgi:acetyl esterase/lipase
MTQVSSIRAQIAALGTAISPDMITAVTALYQDEQMALASQVRVVATDQAYGEHPRHKLDIYAPHGDIAGLPVIVWVHGGGFLRGDKGEAQGANWHNANGGRAAALAGFVGVVMNYRLAPDNPWPAGAEDLAAAVDWLREIVAGIGGDPEKIVLVGTSAGAAHVAGFIKLCDDHCAQVRGAVLLSGTFGVCPLTDHRDLSYYGDDASLHSDRLPIGALVASDLPLLVACAEFDPPNFHQEFVGLLQRKLKAKRQMPRAYVASGHNHFSLALHLGTADRRVLDEIASFVGECVRAVQRSS